MFSLLKICRNARTRARSAFMHIHHVWPNRAPTKGSHRTAAWHFPACGCLFLACCDIQKFTWCITTFHGLWGFCSPCCEIWSLPHLKSGNGSKTAYTCNQWRF